MKIIIAGSRGVTSYNAICEAVTKSGFKINCVVSGTANGPDKLGEHWASEHNAAVLRMPADWERYKKAAGYMRNSNMGDIADGAVIVWDGKSKGSIHMMNVMKKLNKPFYLINLATGEEIVSSGS